MFLASGKCFGFCDVFLDSAKCFVPLGLCTIQLKPFDLTQLFFSAALFCLVCCTNCC